MIPLVGLGPTAAWATSGPPYCRPHGQQRQLFSPVDPARWQAILDELGRSGGSPVRRAGEAIGGGMQPCWPAQSRVRTRTLRRLIGSSVVVGPARYRTATSVRLGWPSADGAGSGRRGGRPGYKPGWGLDPPRLLPVEPTNLASALSRVPVWPGGPCGCWPTRRCCQVGTAPGGAIGPNFGGTLGRCRRRLRCATPIQEPVRPGSCSWWRMATYRLGRSCTARQLADAPAGGSCIKSVHSTHSPCRGPTAMTAAVAITQRSLAPSREAGLSARPHDRPNQELSWAAGRSVPRSARARAPAARCHSCRARSGWPSCSYNAAIRSCSPAACW
jgi:hypothetical protein